MEKKRWEQSLDVLEASPWPAPINVVLPFKTQGGGEVDFSEDPTAELVDPDSKHHLMRRDTTPVDGAGGLSQVELLLEQTLHFKKFVAAGVW